MQMLRRSLSALFLAVVTVVVCASPVLAQVAPDGDVSPDTPASAYLTVNNMLVLLATGAVIPLVNGLLLSASNPRWVKVLVANLFATIVHAFSQQIQEDGTAFLSQEWALGLGITLIAMTAAYFNVWKPTLNPNENMPSLIPIGDALSGQLRAA